MPDNSTEAIAIGQQKATEVLAARKVARERRTAALAAHPAPLTLKVQARAGAAAESVTSAQSAGYLVAAGDSWFDYPFHDVLKQLEDNYGYNVESSAHAGASLESMAYHGGQIDKFARSLEKVVAQGVTPKAALISGGGNDVAGAEFGMLINSASSPIAGWNDEAVDGVINKRIATAYQTILAAVNLLCQQDLGKTVPIVIHGYDYPVPDGRGFLGGWGPLPGPWLKPGFDEKLFPDLAHNVVLIHDLIDRMNTMLSGLPALFPNVRYLNLRGTLSTVLAGGAYKDVWGNELHPTEKGFNAIADKFAAVLSHL